METEKLISGSWEQTLVPQTTFETKQLSFPLRVALCDRIRKHHPVWPNTDDETCDEKKKQSTP